METNHPDYKLIKFSLNPGDPKLLMDFIKCYIDVFADEPWNEWAVCRTCNIKWGIHSKLPKDSLCPDCHQLIERFWNETEVDKDIRNALDHKLNSCYLAMFDTTKQVVGFCFGYAVTAEELEDMLKLSGIKKSLNNYYPKETLFAYQDDMGVYGHHRNKGIARAMFHARINDFIDSGLNIGIARTKTLPPSVPYQWYPRLNYNVIGFYNDADARIVLGANLKAVREILAK